MRSKCVLTEGAGGWSASYIHRNENGGCTGSGKDCRSLVDALKYLVERDEHYSNSDDVELKIEALNVDLTLNKDLRGER